MTIKFSRAQRRADRKRLQKKRQFHWGYGHKYRWGRYTDGRGEICFMDPDVAGKVVNTPTPCSCAMCGNPRRNSAFEGAYGRLTGQEYKAIDKHIDGLIDLAYIQNDFWYYHNNGLDSWDRHWDDNYHYFTEWEAIKVENLFNEQVWFGDGGSKL